jgi:hypothetical protein
VIKDKRLLIVPSGALTQLPFQVLITAKPDAAASGDDALRRAAWLVRKHALTVLPSVSSLKALRQLAKDRHADRVSGFCRFSLPQVSCLHSSTVASGRCVPLCHEQVQQSIGQDARKQTNDGHDPQSLQYVKG